MKKIGLFFIVFTFSITTIIAQNAYINVKGGINGVYNIGDSDISSNISEILKNPGYNVGAEFGFKFFKILGFRGEANYVNNKFTLVTNRTSSELPGGQTGNFSFTETMDVINNGIQIPTSLTLDLGLLDINIGPNFEFLISSIASGDLSNIKDAAQNAVANQKDIDYDFFNDEAGAGAYFGVDPNADAGDYFSKFNLGINLGLGFNIKGLRLDLKTNYTLTEAVNDYYEYNQGEEIYRPINFQLSAVFQLFKFNLLGGDKDDDDKEEGAADLLSHPF